MFLPSAYSDALYGAIETSSWGCNYEGSPGVAMIRINPGGPTQSGRTHEGIRHVSIWWRRAKTKGAARRKRPF